MKKTPPSIFLMRIPKLTQYQQFNKKIRRNPTNNNLMKYSDYILVKGSYAETAIKWATANKVINGMNMPDGTIMISPHSNASRAETAAMLSNMINKFDLLQWYKDEFFIQKDLRSKIWN